MVCFAWVISRVDSSPVFGNGFPALRALSRACTASLNTTRAHPNAFANALCWPVSGYSLKAYRSCMTITLGTPNKRRHREHVSDSSPVVKRSPAPPERHRDAPRRRYENRFTTGVNPGALRMNPGS